MITKEQLKIVLAFGVGTGLGALVAHLAAKHKFEAELEREIEDVKANYRYLRKEDYESPTDFVEKNRPDIIDNHLAALEINEIVEHAKLNEEMSKIAEDYQTGSVFNRFEKPIENPELLPDDANETLFEQLKAMRTEDKPYLVSIEEYHEMFNHFQKQTVTYFAGDNIIAYEDDTIMMDPDETIDVINLSRFGVMSDDENFVYVRNHRLGIDYEIVRDEGKYSEMMARINGIYVDGDDGD